MLFTFVLWNDRLEKQNHTHQDWMQDILLHTVIIEIA